MHKLIVPEKIELTSTEIIHPGEYLVEDLNGAQLMSICGGGTMTPLPESEKRPFDETKDWNGKKVMIMRVGGFGDLVRLTPVLREIKRRWPEVVLNVCTMAHYEPVLKFLDFVDGVVKYPLSIEASKGYDAWVFLENAVEKNPRAKKVHMTDLFAEIIGLTGKPELPAGWVLPEGQALADPKAAYIVTANEGVWANVQYPRKPGVRRVCIQTRASARCRDYPNDQFTAVLKSLLERGWEVFLLGLKGQIKVPENVENLYNLAEAGTSFRQSCAVINGSDAFLGPDSALLHVAGALDVPAVGLYGPFPWELRTKYEPSIFALQGVGTCSPCFHHGNPFKGDQFPPQCPSGAKGFCEVLGSIKPEHVVAKLEKIARKVSTLEAVS